jgi:hypothetical protein
MDKCIEKVRQEELVDMISKMEVVEVDSTYCSLVTVGYDKERGLVACVCLPDDANFVFRLRDEDKGKKE